MSRIKEFLATQYTANLIKLMDEKNLNMVTGGLDQLKDPRFGDLLRIAEKMLRAAGHDEEAGVVASGASGELRPLRYLKLTLRTLPAGQLPDNQGEATKPGDVLAFNTDEHEKILSHAVVKPE